MTINSMTGFATITKDLDIGSLELNIRVVNSRYLDIATKVPDFLQKYEYQICKEISKEIARGKVNFYVTFIPKNNNNQQVNMELAHYYVDQVTQLSKYMDGKLYEIEYENSFLPKKFNINPCDILNLPNVIGNNSTNYQDEIAKEIFANLPTLLTELKKMKAFEGQKLAQIISDKLAEIQNITKEITQFLPEIIEWQKNKLQSYFSDKKIQLNNEILEQEIIIFAQKIDIAEELNRLETHIAHTKEILATGGQCGKKLDFMMQEFNRESNTIASKSVNEKITSLAINLKVIIEQIREQVQNIE